MGNHNDRYQGIERLLNDSRPRPSRQVVQTIALQVERSERPRGAGGRIAMALAVTLVALVAGGTVGGVGYAASSVTHAASAVKVALSTKSVKTSKALSGATKSAKDKGGGGEGDKGGGDHGGSGGGGHGGGDEDPDDDQYKPGKGCGDKNHVHFKEGQCKKLK